MNYLKSLMLIFDFPFTSDDVIVCRREGSHGDIFTYYVEIRDRRQFFVEAHKNQSGTWQSVFITELAIWQRLNKNA